MNTAVIWTIVIYAASSAALALALGARVRQPRTAAPVLAMLAVLAVGGLGTSASAVALCFEGGALAHPRALATMVGAWAIAAPALWWSARRLRALAAHARRAR